MERQTLRWCYPLIFIEIQENDLQNDIKCSVVTIITACNITGKLLLLNSYGDKWVGVTIN